MGQEKVTATDPQVINRRITDDLEEVLRQYGQEKVLSSGEVLFRQGALSDGVYYLESGSLGVYKDEEDDQYLLTVVSPGEMVGELGAATGRPRAATVMAGKQATVIHMSEADFLQALSEAPALAAEIIRIMADRLSNADVVRVTLGRSYHQAMDRIQTLRSQKEQMEELLRLREELAHMIVHDLHNPLSVLFTGLSLMEHAPFAEPKPEYVTSVIETMRRSTQRMQRLVDTLLSIARLEAGKMTLQLVPLDPVSLIEDAIADQRPLAEDKDLGLSGRLPAKLPKLSADREIVRRVLVNLLDNAIKYTPRGGEILVEARQEPEKQHVRIEVIDTGPGIPPEERKRIFEKFTRVRGQTGPRKSTGLGLAFCQMAVEAHEGLIWVEDGPSGEGSRFVFTIPQAQEDSDAGDPTP